MNKIKQLQERKKNRNIFIKQTNEGQPIPNTVVEKPIVKEKLIQKPIGDETTMQEEALNPKKKIKRKKKTIKQKFFNN